MRLDHEVSHAHDRLAENMMDSRLWKTPEPFGISESTTDELEKRITRLEGGIAAVGTASGQAAQMITVLSLVSAGHNIVASSHLYGGTITQLGVTFRRIGITVRFIDSLDPTAFETAIDEKTRAIYIESIANPRSVVNPIKELSEIAHRHEIPLIVDNTLGMGGYLIQPIAHGADIVVQSITKWVGGHGTTLGGMVVDSGNFDWERSGNFPQFCPGIGQGKYGETDNLCLPWKSSAFIAKVRNQTMREIGPYLSPVSAFLILGGLQTLELRAKRHCDNAFALARWLDQHPKVASTSYLGLDSHMCHQQAKKYLRPNAWGGVVSFALRGGSKAADFVVDRLRLCSHLANLGDAKTLVIRPSATTHMQNTAEEQSAAGISNDLIRVSVGIEAISDIIADFEGAFEQLVA